MPICDAVAANLTTLYLGVIAVMKAYGVIAGRSFSGWFVLSVSTAVVLSILAGSLTWDVSRKAIYVLSRHRMVQKSCQGGICWHGVSQVGFSVSQVGFQLPQQHS